MINQFSRTEMLIGTDALAKLKGSCVAVFGAGGVGGYTIEALARSGVGTIHIIDNDTVSLTNINRQIIATHDTIGLKKTIAAKERVLSINPECNVVTHDVFYTPETASQFDFSVFDYVVDAIDTVTGKIGLVLQAKEAGVPIICSMGTGNKTDPTRFEVTDIYKTSVCPLAKVMRHELKKRNVRKLKVVYSKEEPKKPAFPSEEDPGSRRSVPASISFVPPAAGLIIAGEVIKELIND